MFPQACQQLRRATFVRHSDLKITAQLSVRGSGMKLFKSRAVFLGEE
jgi:hypothetical protein